MSPILLLPHIKGIPIIVTGKMGNEEMKNIKRGKNGQFTSDLNFTEEQIRHMVKKYLKGASSYDIAAEYGVSPSTIVNQLREAGCEIKSAASHIDFSENEIEEIVRKYREGTSSTKLAEEFGVSYGTILDRLKKAGCEIRPSPPVRDYVQRDIPEPWTDVDPAYVFGVLIGDGSINYNYTSSGKKGSPIGVRIETPDEEFAVLFSEAVESAFGIRTNKSSGNGERAPHLRLTPSIWQRPTMSSSGELSPGAYLNLSSMQIGM